MSNLNNERSENFLSSITILPFIEQPTFQDSLTLHYWPSKFENVMIRGAVDYLGNRGLIFRFKEPLQNNSHGKYRHLITELANFTVTGDTDSYDAQYFLNLAGTQDVAVLCSFIDSINTKIGERNSLSQSEFFEIFNFVMDEWAELLRKVKNEHVDISKIIGLFGELLLLESLLDRNIAELSDWTGPEADRFDFRLGPLDIEVKTSTSTDSKRIHVHGIDQLEITNRPGCLAFVQIEFNPNGIGLSVLVNRMIESFGDNDKHLFIAKLGKLGYAPEESQIWDRVTFSFFKCALYELGPNFPIITTSSFVNGSMPEGTSQFQYVIDLQAVPYIQIGNDLGSLNWSYSE